MGLSPRQIVEEWIAAYEAGDREKMNRLTAEDMEWFLPRSACWIENPDDPVVRGRENFLRYSEKGGGHFFRAGTMKVEQRQWIEQGNTAVVEWSMTATAHNGKTYKNNYVNIWTVNDKGQICRSAEYLDTAEWQNVLVQGLLRHW